MKSKISFFNKTIFWKNVTLYWPIWGGYTFILMCIMPIMLWLEYNNGFRITPLTGVQKFSRLADVLELTPVYTILIACTAVITGMALFSYLYNSKSANMIHSLPVNRTELFGTNVITGLTFLAVPQVFVFVMTVLLCLVEGVPQVEYLGVWLLVSFATDVIAFSIVTFCAMFTGLIIALPIYVLVLNCLAYVINLLLELVISSFGYGVEYYNLFTQTFLEWLSPLACYMNNVQLSSVYTNGSLTAMQLEGIVCIVVYLIMAIVLYAIAYMVYQKRQIEHAGELITVGFVKPIFRCGIGIIAAMYGSILLRTIFLEVNIEISMFVFVCLLLLIGVIAYFIADMLVRKTFHVFKKQNCIGCGIFSIVLLLTFGGMYGYSELAEHRLPENEDIECAFIELGYMTRYDDEKISFVTDVHKQILENLSYYETLDVTNQYWISDLSYEYVSVYYVMKNGETFSRSYRIPLEGSGNDIINRIIEVEQEPENCLKNLICNNYDELTEFEIGYLNIEYYVNEGGEIGYHDVILSQEQSKLLYDAIVADALEGNLMKYNSYYYEKDESYDGYTYYIEFSYKKLPNSEKGYDYWDYFYSNIGSGYMEMETMSFYVRFGKDCQNIIDAIYECGILEESQRLYWGEEGAWYEDPFEYFMQNAFGVNEIAMIEQFEGGGIYFARYVTNEDGEKVYSNDFLPLTPEQSRELAYGAEKDAYIQTLLKYNPDYINYSETYVGDDSVFLISMGYEDPITGENRSAWIRFGSDCETIANMLVDLGIVESVYDICWDSYYTY